MRNAVTPEAASWRRFVRRNGVLVVFLIFIVFTAIISHGRFIQPSNISVILFQSSVIGVLALGQTLVMRVAGIDLSRRSEDCDRWVEGMRKAGLPE